MNPGSVLFSLTKKVARELDLIETVYLNRSKNAEHLIVQPFQFLIVIDFESTCWKNNRDGKQPEIIEFPAVLLNVRTGMIEEEFQQYVLPVENPILSDFCIKLTGIKQDDIENGMPLQTCLSLFCSWIKEISEKRRLVFHTNQKDSDAGNVCTFVTWSDWDLSVCLHNECRRKQLYKPEFLCQWIDLRATYRKFYKRRPQGLRGALSELGLQFEGREHSGLCDAYNTACLAWRMVQDGAILKVTKVLQTNRHTSRTPLKVIPENKIQCKGDLLKAESLQGTPQSNVRKKLPRQPLKPVNTPLTTQRQSSTAGETDSPIPDTPILVKCVNRRRVASVKNAVGLLRFPIKDENSNSDTKRVFPTMSKTVSSPKVHLEEGNVTTPNAATRHGLSSHKRTPPFCKCGSRAFRRVVSLQGPNQGRSFFICSRRRSLGMLQTSGCGFFCWEFPYH